MAVQTIAPRARFRHTGYSDGACTAPGRLASARPGVWLPYSPSVRVPGLVRDIRVAIASNPWQWEQAFRLVAENYQRRGYERPGASACRFTAYHALPETVVLVAQERSHVVATFSLVADNTLLGLPLEQLYPSEVGGLRREERRINETIGLADRDLSHREFVQVFMAMIRFAWQYMLASGGETSVITVNPRHSDFYRKVLGYLPLGPQRSYPQVEGHPAEAFFVDPSMMRSRVPVTYQRLFGERLPGELLLTPRMPAALVRHFARRSSQTDVRAVDDILLYADACGSPRRW